VPRPARAACRRPGPQWRGGETPHGVLGAPRVCAIRGAITVAADEPCLVWAATRALLAAIVERNGLHPDDIISVLFTVTADLTSAFPARAACQMGWTQVPLLCALEIPVPGALPRCVRVLLHAATDRPRASIAHPYLGDAVTLRPDLSVSDTSSRA